MERCLIFDTGPIITFSLNNLVWLLPQLKERFGGRFLIPAAVKQELIEKPLTTKKYKLEALQLLPLIEDGTFEIIDAVKTASVTHDLLDEINQVYHAHGHPIKIVHPGEIDAIAASLLYGAQAIVVDERNTRYLLETPKKLHRRLERKLHTKVSVQGPLLDKVRRKIKYVKTVRSCEMLTVAFEMGMLDQYLTKGVTRQELKEGVLWGAKLNGCAMTDKEIEALLKG